MLAHDWGCKLLLLLNTGTLCASQIAREESSYHCPFDETYLAPAELLANPMVGMMPARAPGSVTCPCQAWRQARLAC